MAVMPLRTFPVTHSRAPPNVGRRFFETARHDNRIKFARAQNRHDRGAGSRPANARAGRRVEYLSITWTSLEAIIVITVGILAGSVALIGFGADSIIEVARAASYYGG
jgi:hypothetical protein